jgi:hypothetical protein
MSNPKEKADELFDKMLYNDGDKYHHCSHYVGKNCALIAVDEILDFMMDDDKESETCYWANHPLLSYWYEVKKEIEKL